jgi:diguanylate cyclase (GGDEF)-like protein
MGVTAALSALAYAASALALFQLCRQPYAAVLGPLRWALLAAAGFVGLLEAADIVAAAAHHRALARLLGALAAGGELAAALLLFPFLRGVQRRFAVIAGRKIRRRAARANAQADAAHALLAMAERSVPFGHWRLTADGALSWSNHMFDIFGCPADAAPDAAQALAFYKPEDRALIQSHVLAAREDGGAFVLNLGIERGQGQVRHISLRGGGVGHGAVAGVVVDITDLFEAEAKLREAQSAALQARAVLRARTADDPLTGLPNRQSFEETLVREVKRALRANHLLALVLLDVDRLSRYNRAYTQEAGDLCLRHVAQALRAMPRRAGDVLARYGGGTFALLLPLAEARGASLVADRLRAAVQTLAITHADTDQGIVTVSAGIAVMHGARDVHAASELARRAAAALLAAQRQGGDRVWLYDPPDDIDTPATTAMTGAALM